MGEELAVLDPSTFVDFGFSRVPRSATPSFSDVFLFSDACFFSVTPFLSFCRANFPPSILSRAEAWCFVCSKFAVTRVVGGVEEEGETGALMGERDVWAGCGWSTRSSAPIVRCSPTRYPTLLSPQVMTSNLLRSTVCTRMRFLAVGFGPLYALVTPCPVLTWPIVILGPILPGTGVHMALG